MAYETKVILSLLAQQTVRSSSVREVYSIIAKAASAEGMTLAPYDEALKEVEEERAKEKK